MILQTDVAEKETAKTGSCAPGFVNAPRIHTALTAGVEKRLLTWIAQQTPQAIGPDNLTALGFAAQLGAGLAYWLASADEGALWLVNVLLVFNWLGDSLDGTLARVRNRQRPRYGFYVDHIVDTIGGFALMAGLAGSGYVHWPVAAGMLVCFYALSIESYLATYTLGRFHLSHGWFGPTEIRILLAAGNAAAFFDPFSEIGGRQFLLMDVGGAIAIGGMTVMMLTAAVRHTAALYREETLQ